MYDEQKAEIGATLITLCHPDALYLFLLFPLNGCVIIGWVLIDRIIRCLISGVGTRSNNTIRVC